jgi:hypothetical protein
VDQTDGNKIKELPIGDNLLMTGSNITGVSGITAQSITTTTGTFTNVNTQNLTVTAAANLGNITDITITGGTAGQSLITDGAGNVSFSNVANYNQDLNTTDDVTFNTVATRRITAPINVSAEIRTSSTGAGTKEFTFTSTGNLQLPGALTVAGNLTVDGNIITLGNVNADGIEIPVSFTAVYGALSLQNAYGNSSMAMGMSDAGFFGGEGQMIFEGNNASGYALVPSNNNQYTLGRPEVAGPGSGAYWKSLYTYNVDFPDLTQQTTAARLTVVGDDSASSTFDAGDIIYVQGTGGITTSVAGPALTITVGGNIAADVTGNITGDVTGNVQGSVFANDSTQMINAVTGKVVGPIQVDVSNISILGGSADQVLKTNGAGVLSWVTQSGGPGGGAVVLDDLTDVVITSVSAGQVLKYDGANWINSAVPLNAFGTITVLGSGINITPDQLNDTLTFIASTGISMTADASTDSITITNTAPNVIQNAFTTVAVAGQTSVAADSSTDTLTLVAGANVTITTDAGTDSITINAGQSNSFVSIAVAGQSPVLADSTSDTLTLVGSGITITTDSVTDTITFSNAGTGLESRTTAAGTTASLASLASADLNITGFKGYVLLKIQTSVAAWVRLYTDAASRTADAGRLEAVDPDPGSGVIAEVITTGGQTILMSPAVMGFNNETSPTTNIPCRVTNKSGSSVAVTVTLTLIKIEA